MTRFLKNLVLIPIAIVLIALAVANRHTVTLSLDPFSRVDPAVSVEAPLFWFLFAAVAFGVFIGGVASWAGQGKWRKEARVKRREADQWHREADRLKAVQEPAPKGPQLPAPSDKSRSAA
ncbi:LapA family protein [Stappia sp.]|uniref:LapA family protein n=1 Tax=Stappia sp. TaxID=1870903 RepID=UPI0032D985B6